MVQKGTAKIVPPDPKANQTAPYLSRMKAICIPAFDRPELFDQTLRHIEANNPHGWTVYVAIDGSGMNAVYGVWPFEVKPWRSAIRLGCSLNSFTVCFNAIAHGAEAILFMDDDIILSPDALALCDWYLKREHGPNDAGIALCRKDGNDPTQPELVSDKDTWMGHLGQGWCFTRQMWFDFVLRNWWQYEPGMGQHDTYDWALGYMAQKLGKVILRPRFARAKHNGAVGFHGPGIGVFPEKIADGAGYNYRIE